MTDHHDAEEAPNSEQPDVGPWADEAVRLAGAFSAWASRNTAGLGLHAQEVAGAFVHGLRESLTEADHHLATGAQECTVCPVCRAVAAVREVSPEVKAHLGQAATSLLAAASGLLASFADGTRSEGERGPGEGDPGSGGTTSARSATARVEHIDLDADEDSVRDD